MNFIEDRYQRWLQETEELISLAEKSTYTVDHLIEIRSKIKKKYIALAILAYAFISTIAVLFLNGHNLSYGVELATILTGVFLLLVIIILAFYLAQDSKKINRDLKVEFSIHQRLISMADDQISSCSPYVEVSPVVIAIFEMRVRRLDREY